MRVLKFLSSRSVSLRAILGKCASAQFLMSWIKSSTESTILSLSKFSRAIRILLTWKSLPSDVFFESFSAVNANFIYSKVIKRTSNKYVESSFIYSKSKEKMHMIFSFKFKSKWWRIHINPRTSQVWWIHFNI